MSTSNTATTEHFELCAKDLEFAYGGRTVLRGVSLSLCPGEILSLLGANGSGKTTLLRLLLGLAKPKQGVITFNGKPLAVHGPRVLARHIAYVPQTHVSPFPYRVIDIALLGRLPQTGLVRSPKRQDYEVAMQALARLGIEHLATRPYTEISGGERQLTLIARALAQGARLLVMDEPVSGLDYGNQLRFLEQLRGLANDGYAIVKATHHPEHTLLASTRVAVLCDGIVVLDGPPAEVITPDTIQRIYQVEVTSYHSPDGKAVAFQPSRIKPANPGNAPQQIIAKAPTHNLSAPVSRQVES
jgi:iron complex transport system ATP-binding protein